MKNRQATNVPQMLTMATIGFCRIKFFLIFLIAAIFCGCSAGSGPIAIPDTSASPALTLIWSDEFNGTALDTSKWNYETGYGSDGWGNDEWQLYTNSNDNIKVENGNLVVTVRCASGNCGDRGVRLGQANQERNAAGD